MSEQKRRVTHSTRLVGMNDEIKEKSYKTRQDRPITGTIIPVTLFAAYLLIDPLKLIKPSVTVHSRKKRKEKEENLWRGI